MYKLAFFVPDSHVEAVKAAVFAAGGGHIGNYDHCAWQTLGQGQFRPLDGSQPFSGRRGEVERLEEWKVELVVADDAITQVVAALKDHHPYETPAYDVWQLLDI
ncbi:YqfO family protein [Pseudomonas sp.]|uniref:YqfO family protein n=1 Tax=Pseudomonas sp. TaxID=306 RepID=UPI0028A9E9D4|nr:YqfO family protein [Pseudomonas sp.]